ncbi:MAG: YhgE/Pip family protein [Clostridium sp.]|uniref:YhgE/Pip family protein n=1 Tax=Clostridium sp. TaxID=1506 RepID=UPI003EE5AFF1
MRVFKIFKKDLKRLMKNKVALGIVIGLCIIPSLYTWITLKANWNPYVDTGNVPIAVVNEDQGTIINNQIVNFGDQTVKQLDDNNSMKWTVVGQKVGDQGLKDGEYYAEIIIPSDFSAKLRTIASGNPIKPDLIYRVNEKTNAIATKISDLAVGQLQDQIKQTFFDSVNKVILNAGNTLGKNIKTNAPLILNLKNVVNTTNSNIQNIINNIGSTSESTQNLANYLAELKNDIPNIESQINNLQSVVGSSKYLIEQTKNNINGIEQNLNGINSNIQNTNNSLNTFISNLKDTLATQEQLNNNALQGTKDALGVTKKDSNTVNNDINGNKLTPDQITKDKNILENIIAQNKKLSSLITSASNMLGILNNIAPSENLQNLKNSLDNLNKILNKQIDELTDLENYLSNDNGVDFSAINSKLDNITSLTNELTSGINSFTTNYSNSISNDMNSISNNLQSGLNNIDGMLQSSKELIPALNQIANLGIDSSNLTVNKANELKSKLDGLKGTLDKVQEQTSKLNNGSLNSIVNILEKNPEQLANLLASPVGMNVQELYGMSIFGVGLAPFYTVLSIWVGALLCTTILSTEDEEEDDTTKKGILNIHFGKMLLFIVINFIQATIVTAGDILLIGIKPADIPLLFAFAWFSGVVFTVIIFTLVSLSGNFGKAAALVIMVIQVAGSGAIYPIEVNPVILQKLEFLWPFTYAIDGFREAIGGPDWSKVGTDFFALLIFLLIFIVIGFMKVFTSKVEKKVVKMFKESEL